MNLSPCPFCGLQLEKSEIFSTRATQYFVHPRAEDGEECVAQSIRVPVSDRADDKRVVEGWNRRENPTPETRGNGE